MIGFITITYYQNFNEECLSSQVLTMNQLKKQVQSHTVIGKSLYYVDGLRN
jgi:hypothetical protein